MAFQFFAGRNRHGERLKLPMSYRATVKWLPRLGDSFPDFTARSTQGRLQFRDWALGHWVYLVSHPAAFTAVCTTEIAGYASAASSFGARGVKVLTICPDPVEVQAEWAADIERLFGVEIDFPMVEDDTGYLFRAFGMMHPKEHPDVPIRKSMVLDPMLRIRTIQEYPRTLGRGTDEVLRTIDALQMTSRTGLAAGADWVPGEEAFLIDSSPERIGRVPRGKEIVSYAPYLRTVRDRFAREMA